MLHAPDGLRTWKSTVGSDRDNRAFDFREDLIDQLFTSGRRWFQAGQDEAILKRTDNLIRVCLIFVFIVLVLALLTDFPIRLCFEYCDHVRQIHAGIEILRDGFHRPTGEVLKLDFVLDDIEFGFGDIAYDQTDIGHTYIYTITETGDVKNVTNDAPKTVTVRVEYDAATHGLKVTNSEATTPAVFENVFAVAGTTALKGVKTLEGREFTAGDAWTFTVKAEDTTEAEGVTKKTGAAIPMPKSASATVRPTRGTEAAFSFGKIHYTQTDIGHTYTYTITETGNVENVTNDTPKTVTVAVEYDGTSGKLVIVNSADERAPVFTNKYTEPEPTTEPTTEPTAKPTSSPTATPKATRKPGTGTTATPRPTPVPTVAISGVKVWDDEGNAHNTRPDSITLRLYANDDEVSAAPQWISRSGNNWSYSFGEYPSVDEDGKTIRYIVREDAVAGYETSVSGTVVTNRLIHQEPKAYAEISGEKIWEDDDNAAKKRPGHITIHLLRNGEAVDQRTVTSATDWRYSFGELPLDDGYGNDYTYSVREDAVEGYFTRINGYSVTNTLLKETEDEISEDGTDEGNTGLDGLSALSEEEQENLLDLFDPRTALFGGLLATGDDVPPWVFATAGAGLLALIAFVALGRRKKETGKG